MPRIASIIISCFFLLNCFGQTGFSYEDQVYESEIKSIKFHIQGLFTSMPIIDLASKGQLTLTFDDIKGGDRYFKYRIIHCDKEWKVSEISELDYLNGFNDEDIENVYYSVGTKLNYTNYELLLPNKDTGWRISGNYVLLVYDEDTLDPVLTRRFIVAENLVSILPSFNNPLDVLLLKSHQEVNFTVNHKNFDIERPLQSLYAAIIQNGRWDNMIINVQPKYNTSGLIHYDRTQRINFDSYKEFRSFDIRSTRVLSNSIHSIDIHAHSIDVLLNLDKERTGNNIYFEQVFGDSRRDINGEFIIETIDDNDRYTEAEYVNTYFNFQTRHRYLDSDIYLFGKFTDWKIQDEFKLEYDNERELYRTNVLLKQGYYDYIYVQVDKNDHSVTNAFEGSWHETENDYTIILYYRRFGGRYDRVIAVRSFNSENR